MLRYRLPTLLLLFSVATLAGFGTVMLYSTTAATSGESLLKLQFIWISAGLLVGTAVYLLDYRKMMVHSKWLLLLVGLPLFYLASLHVASMLGVPDATLGKAPFVKGATKGAFRWLNFGDRTIQPSEFAKIAILMFMAHWYGRNPRYVDSKMNGLLKPMLAVGTVTALILAGGSLSVTVITGSVVMGLLFIAGIRLRWFIGIILLGAAVGAAVVHFSPERMSRITTFRNPEALAADEGYQLWNSELAIGSGGLWGRGFNQSRMKQAYLPEAHTDFIVAIIGEELGYVAIAAVIVLYVVLFLSACLISIFAADREGMLLAFGIGLMTGLQAFVNLSVVSGFLPTTGVTAPLLSYGGSSMLVTWVAIGLLANVARIAQRESETAAEATVQQEKLLTQTGIGALNPN